MLQVLVATIVQQLLINIAFINCCIYNLSLRFRREKLNSLELDRKQQFCSVAAKVTNSKQKVLLFTLSIFSALLNFEKKKGDDGY